MTAEGDGSWNELADFARGLARAAGDAILPHFRMGGDIDNKAGSGFDPVTEADRAAERVMRDMIERRYPDHGIVGEEFGPKLSRSPFTWILDPIDGTRSFICGIPTWTTLIGLARDGEARLGVVSQPFVEEMFIGGPFGSWSEHKGARRKLAVKPAASLSAALLTTVAPEIYKTSFQKAVLERLQSATRMIRFGGDAYFFAMLAAGRIDIAMDAGLQTYDIAALVPLIANAGGVVTTWDGGPPTGGGDIIAAASPALHEAALEIIRSARE